ncbi:hypothetical protein COO60DRAFT_810182 [Scenedesmus sp. NREL 46B-D3]|nr:hypothetical protein COO60DRAFT_810182 [Scenedesmus sp. NREL 46B-D3]
MLLHHIAGHTATSSSRCSVRLSAPLPNVAVRVTSFNAQQCRRPIVACTSPVSSCSANSHRVHRRQQRSLVCRSTTFTEPLPEDLQLELNSDAAAKEVTYDEETKTVRIPLAAVGDGQRRTKMVMFTCNKCGGRSARLVNPVAWERGAVFCQCQHCEVWHTLAAHPSILEEIRYNILSGSYSSKAAAQQQLVAAGVCRRALRIPQKRCRSWLKAAAAAKMKSLQQQQQHSAGSKSRIQAIRCNLPVSMSARLADWF